MSGLRQRLRLVRQAKSKCAAVSFSETMEMIFRIPGFRIGELPPVDAEITAYFMLGAVELLSFRVSIDEKYNKGDFLRQVAHASLSLKHMAGQDFQSLYMPYSSFISKLEAESSSDFVTE